VNEAELEQRVTTAASKRQMRAIHGAALLRCLCAPLGALMFGFFGYLPDPSRTF